MENNIKDFIRYKFEEVKDLDTRERNKQIIQSVKKKFNEIITGDNIYEICCRIGKQRKEISDLQDTIESKKMYEITDDYYIFHQKKPNLDGDIIINKHPISISTVDSIFKDYSKHGGNLSGEEILQKYSPMSKELFGMLKSRLGLSKDSHVISPITLDRLSPEELQVHLDGAIDEHLTDRYRTKFIKTYDKKKEEMYKKMSKTLGNIDYFLEHIKQASQNIDWEYTPNRISTPKNSDVGRYFVTDVHFGKEGTEAMIKRLWMIRDEIMSMPQGKIVLHNLGDLMEGLIQDGLHFGHIEEMEILPHDQLVLATKTFRDILIYLYENGKDIEFHTIGGNHDRIGNNHDQDIMRTGNYWFASMLKLMLDKTNIKIHCYTHLIGCYQSEKVNYVFLHRDQGLDKKKPEDIIMVGIQDGTIDPHKYTMIFGGHTHASEFKETTSCKYTVVPSLASGDQYSRFKIVKHSVPGYVRVMENQYGLVDVEFKALP